MASRSCYSARSAQTISNVGNRPFVFVTARGEANTDKDAVLPGHVDSRGGFIAEATIHEAAISRGLL